MSNANYTGGFRAGAQLFAVDGNFTSCDPCGPPMFSWPMKGDSILSIRDIVYLDITTKLYATVPLGQAPNLQPWSPNQDCILLEQEFMVAQASFQPMRLNTPYDPFWSIGWDNSFPDAQPIPNLAAFIFVSEGELQDMGGGISKIKRTWATVPPTRNEIEQFTYSFIGFDSGGDVGSRARNQVVVQSRVQYDYFVFDDFNVLTIPIFPGGLRLNGDTGLSPDGLILQAQFYYADAASVDANIYIDTLSDGDGVDPATATVPSLSAYKSIMQSTGTIVTSNGLAAELVAESSAMCRYMGNIWERRTRFVIAQ